jgi:hypothetical protein
MNNSKDRDGKTRIYPCPLMSAEKLETQNGIRNSRNVCQGFDDAGVSLRTLNSRATPTMALIPNELSQIPGEVSKCATTVTKYQIK